MEDYNDIMALTWDDSTPDVNQEVTATLTFTNSDVRAVYIDWDDGTSNKKDEANYQWVTSTEPKGTMTVKHTYNQAGVFKPIIQTVNSSGFISRYYGSESSNTNIVPYSQDSTIASSTVSDKAPSAIMKIENTENNSGIDNSILREQGAKQLYIAIAPTVTRTELTGTIKQVTLSVEGVTHVNSLVQNSSDDTEAQFGLGSMSKLQTLEFDINFTTAANQYGVYDFYGEANSNTIGLWSQVLKFKYVSCKATGTTAAAVDTDYTTNEIFNRLKIFLVTKAADGKYYPISYVSAGSPIKNADDNTRYSTLDMGQSRAAASNKTISNYRYDSGKGWLSPIKQWDLETIVGTTKTLGSGTKQTSSIVTQHYSYLINPIGLNNVAAQALFGSGGANIYPWYNPPIGGATTSGNLREDSVGLDDFGRLYDQYYCTRTSVQASSNSGSSINSNQPEVFRISPAPNWSTPQSITETPVSDHTSAMLNNGSGNSFKLSSVNAETQKDIKNADSLTQEAEYLLLTFDSKTNKIFFNATNYTNGLQSGLTGYTKLSGLKVAGVEYLHIDESGTKKQNAYWKNVDFVDTTKIYREKRDTSTKKYDDFHTSFAKSGFISFDMPHDWSNTSIKKLCGGQYNTASGTFSNCVAAGQDDVVVTGTATNVAGVSGYGDGMVKVTLSAAADKTAMQTIGTEDDVGAYKYAFIVTTGTASGSMWWVASGGANGWDEDTGNGIICLQVGNTGTSASNAQLVRPAGTITGSVRRINIYDVVDGTPKVFQDGGAGGGAGGAGASTNWKLMPAQSQYYKIDSGGSAANVWFPNQYNLRNAIFTGSSWATNDKYLLKITLSGQTNAGTVDQPCPELWNIFDASSADTTIIKSVDDSAYNLNSIPITSDISMRRSGIYYRAITRKGKTFIAKTGVGLEQVGFSSKALGDENSSTAFEDHGPGTMYGYLHKVRKLQEEGVPVYWDEKQKDGTYIRLWGVIGNLNETRASGGPRATMSYTCNMIVKDIALLDTTGKLMTDRFPLGGVADERDYS